VRPEEVDVLLKMGSALDIAAVRKKPKEWISGGCWGNMAWLGGCWSSGLMGAEVAGGCLQQVGMMPAQPVTAAACQPLCPICLSLPHNPPPPPLPSLLPFVPSFLSFFPLFRCCVAQRGGPVRPGHLQVREAAPIALQLCLHALVFELCSHCVSKM
jgi:hypothetical protein